MNLATTLRALALRDAEEQALAAGAQARAAAPDRATQEGRTARAPRANPRPPPRSTRMRCRRCLRTRACRTSCASWSTARSRRCVATTPRVEKHIEGARGRRAPANSPRPSSNVPTTASRPSSASGASIHPQPTFLHVPKLPEYEFYNRADFPWLAEFEAASPRDPRRVRTRDARGLRRHRAVHRLSRRRARSTSGRSSTSRATGARSSCGATVYASMRMRIVVRAPPSCSHRRPRPTFRATRRRRSFPSSTASRTFRRIAESPTRGSSCTCRWWCPRNAGSAWDPRRANGARRKAWVFDDTIEHEAWNDSDVPRAILIFDTWHPALTRGERELIRTAVPAIKDYYRDEVTISGSEG